LPVMAPAWTLGWFRNVAPRGVEPRFAIVRDRDVLIGIAPFYVMTHRKGRIDYRIPAIEMGMRLAPLALPGREWEVAAAAAKVLARAQPRPDIVAFEGLPVASPWLVGLREGWPGRTRPPTRTYNVLSSPIVSLDGPSFEDWLAHRSSNFRGQMRRAQRQFHAAGGTVRRSTPETLVDDVQTLLHLHASRWENRERASSWVALGSSLQAMLEEAGKSLLGASDRFRLQMLEVEGEPISAQLFISAGQQVLYVNGGWDERFSSMKPAQLAIFLAIEEAFAAGDRCVDLGAGVLHYKLRFSNGDDPVSWNILMVPSPQLPLTWARTLPMLTKARVRIAAKRMLSDAQVEQLRRLRTRGLALTPKR
jgi:CelD/BcsL family acetyltransferase involved in cellulose biosynthesis